MASKAKNLKKQPRKIVGARTRAGKRGVRKAAVNPTRMARAAAAGRAAWAEAARRARARATTGPRSYR